MIVLTDLNTKKINHICSTLEEIQNVGLSIADKIEDKTNNIDYLIYRDYFERFIYCFDSVKTLLVGYNEKTYSKDYALALILRTSLLDFLTVVYLAIHYQEQESTSKSKNNYKSELGKILSSHIRRTFDRLNKDYLSGYIKECDYSKMIHRLYLDYIFLFDETMKFDLKNPLNTLRFKEEISNKTIIDKIANHPDKTIKSYSRAAGYYEIYSKYEHCGIISRRLQRMNVNERFKNILDSLELLVDGAAFSIQFFRNIENIEKEEIAFRDSCGHLKGLVICKTI